MEIPDKVELGYLERRQDDPKWADFLIDNWQNVLAAVDGEDFPAAAYTVSLTVFRRSSKGLDETGRTSYCTVATRAANAGLEWMEQVRRGHAPASSDPGNGLVCGNLCKLRGKTLLRLNRPIEAIRMFETAALHYSAYQEALLDEGTDSDPADTARLIAGCGVDVAEALYRYCNRLPDVAKRTQLSFVISYLQTAYDSYKDIGDTEGMEHVEKVFQIPARLLDDLGGVDRDRMSEIERSSFNDDYMGWICQNRLFMNMASQMPKVLDEWMNDDLNFLPDDLSAMILTDAFYAFDHCREAFYEFYNLDGKTRYEEGRSLDVEILIDVYLRLLTILNKIGWVLDNMYTSNGKTTDFRNVGKSLKFNRNKYIRAIAGIIEELFPGYDRKDVSPDSPESSVTAAVYCNTFVCNAITNGVLSINDLDEQPFLQPDMAAISPDYLEHHVMILLRAIREIVVMLQIAQYE